VRVGASVAAFAASILALGATASSAFADPMITEYSSGLTPNSTPEEIVTGADGNLWFTEDSTPGRIGRITPSGTITEFGQTQGLSTNGGPLGITRGPDGNVWFAETSNPGRIGKITPSGAITEYTGGVAPGFSANTSPEEITTGPDGNLWFTEAADPGAVARITPSGVVTEFKGGVAPGFTANRRPNGITTGPDGNLWFTEISGTDSVARMTTSGNVTEFNVAPSSQPLEIAPGPDGALWFTEFNDPGRVGRITTGGTVTEITGGVAPGFSANRNPSYIVTGPDGNLWFSEYGGAGAIARLTSSGQISEFSSGITAGSGPYGTTLGPDGNLWFVEFNDPGRIGRLTTPPAATTGSASVLGAGAATVGGLANGHAQPTSYRFEYGPTAGYGAATAPVAAGSGFATVGASGTLTGLKPNTTYHYRLDVTNPTGTTTGADATFTTSSLPALSNARLSHARFRRGRKPVHISRRHRRPPVGTTITFSLSRGAPVRLGFYTTKPGRRVHGKCRAPSRRNRHARACRRLVLVGSISFLGHAGTNTVRFQGRISAHKTLKPGSYRLQIAATDPTDPVPSTKTLRFTIVKG